MPVTTYDVMETQQLIRLDRERKKKKLLVLKILLLISSL